MPSREQFRRANARATEHCAATRMDVAASYDSGLGCVDVYSTYCYLIASRRVFNVQCADMRRILHAADGEVNKLTTLHLLIEQTRIQEYPLR